MKNTTFKLLALFLLVSSGWNLTAQEQPAPTVIVLQNLPVDQQNITEETVTTTPILSQEPLVHKTSLKVGNEQPIYIVDGIEIEDLNRIDSSSIVDVVVQGNAILISTIHSTALVSN